MRGLIFLDFRVLGQRMKIGVRYEKFGELQKQESVDIRRFSQQKKTGLTVNELYQMKNEIFMQSPHINLSIENFSSLHVIEEYLLRKFSAKEAKGRQMHHNERFGADYDEY